MNIIFKVLITVILSGFLFVFVFSSRGSLSVGVVLQQIVGNELQGVLRPGMTNLVQCTHDGWCDGSLQVGLSRQRIHIHSCLPGHGSELSSEAFIGVIIATFGVEVGVQRGLLCRVQVVRGRVLGQVYIHHIYLRDDSYLPLII